MNGKFISTGLVQTYPFRFPMPLKSRLSILTTGAKVGFDVLRYTRAVKSRPGETGEVRQQRIYDFENDRTFADYIGRAQPGPGQLLPAAGHPVRRRPGPAVRRCRHRLLQPDLEHRPGPGPRHHSAAPPP